MTEKPFVAHWEVLLRNLHPQVRTRPMFGEYGGYLGEKFAVILADNRCFLKVKGVPEDVIAALFDNRDEPYPGAKNYSAISEEQISNPEWCEKVREALVSAKVLPSLG